MSKDRASEVLVLENSTKKIICPFCKEEMYLAIPFREDHAHYGCEKCNINFIVYFKDLTNLKR